jgi:hypothetical protein
VICPVSGEVDRRDAHTEPHFRSTEADLVDHKIGAQGGGFAPR